MSNYETTTELSSYVEEEIREPSDGTSVERPKIVRQLDWTNKKITAGGMGLNKMLKEIGGELKEPIVFPWARSKFPKIVNFEAPYETGTITATLNSTSITFSSAPANSLANFYLKITGEDEVYRIATHSAASTSASLDAAYVNTSGAGKSFVAFRLVYDFGSDIMKPISPLRIYGSGQGTDGLARITVISKENMDLYFPLYDIRQQVPTRAAVIKDDGSGTISLYFNAYPQEAERMEMEYIPYPADLNTSGSNPLMPRDHRKVIADFTIYFMLRQLDDGRALDYLRSAKGLLDDLILDARAMTDNANPNFGQVYPNERDVHPDLDRLLRTEDGFIIGD